MKVLAILTAICLAAATAACNMKTDDMASGPIEDLNMGLSKTSVFDTPTPDLYDYSDAKPGYNDRLARAWEELPPLVPHRTEEYLPVTIEDNQCLDCHDVPKYIDKPLNTDRTVKNKSPMSRNHYASMDLEDLDGARFNCTQCHVPVSNAPPLVENTY